MSDRYPSSPHTSPPLGFPQGAHAHTHTLACANGSHSASSAAMSMAFSHDRGTGCAIARNRQSIKSSGVVTHILHAILLKNYCMRVAGAPHPPAPGHEPRKLDGRDVLQVTHSRHVKAAAEEDGLYHSRIVVSHPQLDAPQLRAFSHTSTRAVNGEAADMRLPPHSPTTARGPPSPSLPLP